MATVFFTPRPMTFPVYLTKKSYKSISFECMSNGQGMFVSNDDNLTQAILRSNKYKEGIITCPSVPESATQPETVSETVTPTETKVEEAVQEEEQTDALKDIEFPDVASAKEFLVREGVKASEIRSIKAIKEHGRAMGYNITIEE